jgi:hypothetical protein
MKPVEAGPRVSNRVSHRRLPNLYSSAAQRFPAKNNMDHVACKRTMAKSAVKCPFAAIFAPRNRINGKIRQKRRTRYATAAVHTILAVAASLKKCEKSWKKSGGLLIQRERLHKSHASSGRNELRDT